MYDYICLIDNEPYSADNLAYHYYLQRVIQRIMPDRDTWFYILQQSFEIIGASQKVSFFFLISFFHRKIVKFALNIIKHWIIHWERPIHIRLSSVLLFILNGKSARLISTFFLKFIKFKFNSIFCYSKWNARRIITDELRKTMKMIKMIKVMEIFQNYINKKLYNKKSYVKFLNFFCYFCNSKLSENHY